MGDLPVCREDRVFSSPRVFAIGFRFTMCFHLFVIRPWWSKCSRARFAQHFSHIVCVETAFAQQVIAQKRERGQCFGGSGFESAVGLFKILAWYVAELAGGVVGRHLVLLGSIRGSTSLLTP